LYNQNISSFLFKYFYYRFLKKKYAVKEAEILRLTPELHQ